MWGTPSWPSWNGVPPHVPIRVSLKTNARPSRKLAKVGRAGPPQLSAATFSGTASARAPNRQSIMRRPVMPRAPQAAGWAGLTIDPGGALTVMGRV